MAPISRIFRGRLDGRALASGLGEGGEGTPKLRPVWESLPQTHLEVEKIEVFNWEAGVGLCWGQS